MQLIIYILLLYYIPIGSVSLDDCSPNHFKCNTTDECITRMWVCDGVSECTDGSDEMNCGNYTCPNMFQCYKGGPCVNMNLRCNKVNDCENNQDEINCNLNCSANQFKCKNSKCISLDWRCDGDSDCDDGDDEIGCSCDSSSHFNCTDMSACIKKDQVCDHTIDCNDGSDEMNCEENDNDVVHCMDDHFRCKITMECMHKKYKCDGQKDCEDGSDEDNCGHNICPNGTFTCQITSYHNSTYFTDHCVEDYKRCDGIQDCNDNSDELETDGSKCRRIAGVCNKDEFDCKDDGSECTSLSHVCDGTKQCEGGEDEAFDTCSAVNSTCKIDNGQCSQICSFDFRQRCECYHGYKLSEDDKTCEDINECETEGICSHICTDVPKHNFTCSCFDGYHVDELNTHLCIADGKQPSLLFAHKIDIRLYKLNTKDYNLVANKTISAIAIDYDYTEQIMYWTSMRMSIIYKQPIFNSTIENRDAVLNSGMDLSDGIAFDWIHKNLYWTDTGLNKIGMMSVISNPEHKHKILFNYDLDEPRAIVVDPRDDQGWFYWTDWGKTPSIERAGLDGTHRQTIFTGDEIIWANGLTIGYNINHYSFNHLYWCDAKLSSIRRIDFNGSNVKLILHSFHLLRHPFSITVFQDTLYWTDWNTDSIYSASKFNGSKAILVHKIRSPMGVVIHHESRQPKATNQCSADYGGCSDICVPNPRTNKENRRFSCLCTTGRKLGVDDKTCYPVIAHKTTVAPEEHKKRAKHRGLIIFISIVLVLCSLLLIAMLAKKYYLRTQGKPLNFENTIYRKTTNQISIDTEYFHSPNDRIPLTSEPIFAQTDSVYYADT